MDCCAESTLLVKQRHSAVRKVNGFARLSVGYDLRRRYCSHQVNSQGHLYRHSCALKR
jgi:hypothetical protein